MDLSQNPPQPPPPPSPPGPPPAPQQYLHLQGATLGTIRQTYMSLFNQILNLAINFECICKTTKMAPPKKKRLRRDSSPSSSSDEKITNKTSKKSKKFLNVFDQNNYLNDEEEDDDNEYDDETMCRTTLAHKIKNETDTGDDDAVMSELGLAFAYSNRIGTFLRDSDYDSDQSDSAAGDADSARQSKFCDCSCVEKMRIAYTLLRDAANRTRNPADFDRLWSTLRFLSRCPTSCDYSGATIFHIAASDEDNPFVIMRCLEKYPDGVKCVDCKGMTPLMRAVQRNLPKIVSYLLNHTESDLNGSVQSTYTPLWFAVSNGYADLSRMLLDFNASPCIVEKSTTATTTMSLGLVQTPMSAQTNALLDADDMSGTLQSSPSSSSSTSPYLFSPLRASIVYARYDIMAHLLEFNACVHELFGQFGARAYRNLPKPGRAFNSKINEDYLSSLKFFYRQFGPREQQPQPSSSSYSHDAASNLDLQLTILNEFVDDVNVYRRMLVEFVRNLVHK